MNDSQRQFIRHPIDIPLEFSMGENVEKMHSKDVGDGGLCFICQHHIDTGEQIHIMIPVCEPEFKAQGTVCWCKNDGAQFLIGVSFQQESEMFAVRMVEQVCHIEDYRSKVKSEQGIDLSSEQAAMEWISQHAADFPQLSS